MGEQIIQNGHNAIGIIGGLTRDNDRATDRIRGICQCFSDHGRPIPEELILEAPYHPKDSAQAFDELLREKSRSDSYILWQRRFSSRSTAQSSRQRYRCSGQLSITGFDDIALAKILQPQLTTVHLPHRFMGEMAAKALFDAVINNEPVQSLEIPFSIRDRGTLAKLS